MSDFAVVVLLTTLVSAVVLLAESPRVRREPRMDPSDLARRLGPYVALRREECPMCELGAPGPCDRVSAGRMR